MVILLCKITIQATAKKKSVLIELDLNGFFLLYFLVEKFVSLLQNEFIIQYYKKGDLPC